jgi:hypothetical protein
LALATLVLALFGLFGALFGTLTTASVRALPPRTKAAAPPAPAAEISVTLLLALGRLALQLLVVAAGGLSGIAAVFVFRPAFVAKFLISAEPLCLRLRRRRGRLHGAQQAEIMVSVLKVIFAEHAIPRGCRIPRQLQIALMNM